MFAFVQNEGLAVGSLEKTLLDKIRRREPISKNINLVHDESLTFGQRVADALADWAGSWTFIISFFVILAAWLVINSLALLTKPFDPFPFILLNLVLSCLAAIPRYPRGALHPVRKAQAAHRRTESCPAVFTRSAWHREGLGGPPVAGCPPCFWAGCNWRGPVNQRCHSLRQSGSLRGVLAGFYINSADGMVVDKNRPGFTVAREGCLRHLPGKLVCTRTVRFHCDASSLFSLDSSREWLRLLPKSYSSSKPPKGLAT